jgi:hypothetical protein
MSKSPAKVAAAPVVRTDPLKSAKTVTVASKLPFSIWLHVDKPVTKRVPGRYGSEAETVYEPDPSMGQVYIRGTQEPAGQAPKKYRRPEMVDGGFALTHNVRADFWEAWREQHATDDMVVNGLIYAHASIDHAEGHSAEHAKLESGFQPLNPDALDQDPRMPRPINITEIENVEYDEEQRRRRPIAA